MRLGAKSVGAYEVVGGLREGDRVVTSGNFLLDAESRLTGAGEGWATPCRAAPEGSEKVPT